MNQPYQTNRLAVELRGISKSYGETIAVQDVDLSVAEGEFISLLGASGSGKSTLLRLIAGFDTPTSGSIVLNGDDVSSLSPADREIGMVFQNYALFPHLTVEGNIQYGLRMRRWTRERMEERTNDMVARMRLDGLVDRYPRQLSGGQQQRVAIARALAYEPRLLLMDEPLGALDKALKQNLLDEIRRVHRDFGTTILYVTHDREEALTLSDRVAIMEDSRLVACAGVHELFLNPPTPHVARFFAEANTVPAALVEVRGGDTPDATAGRLYAVRPRMLSFDSSRGDLLMAGTVKDLVFLGDEVKLKALIRRGGSETVEITAIMPAEAARDAAIGAQVSLTASLRDVQVFEQEPELR